MDCVLTNAERPGCKLLVRSNITKFLVRQEETKNELVLSKI